MPTNEIRPHPFLISLVQSCSLKRFKLAVDALSEETPPVVLTHVGNAVVRALVASGDKEYGVTLTASLSTCSCRDFAYRGEVCKHQILVALHALRTPAPQPAIDVPAIPIPVDVAPIACTLPEGVVSPRPCLVWRDGLTVCGESHPHGVRMWPWTAPTLEAACQDCKSVFANGYQKHMIHLMSHKHAA